MKAHTCAFWTLFGPAGTSTSPFHQIPHMPLKHKGFNSNTDDILLAPSTESFPLMLHGVDFVLPCPYRGRFIVAPMTNCSTWLMIYLRRGPAISQEKESHLAPISNYRADTHHKGPSCRRFECCNFCKGPQLRDVWVPQDSSLSSLVYNYEWKLGTHWPRLHPTQHSSGWQQFTQYPLLLYWVWIWTKVPMQT